MNPSEAHRFVFTRDQIIFEQRKHEEEITRKQTYFLLQPYGSDAKPIPKPEKFWPLPGDKNVPEMTPEELTPEAWEQLDKRYN